MIGELFGVIEQSGGLEGPCVYFADDILLFAIIFFNRARAGDSGMLGVFVLFSVFRMLSKPVAEQFVADRFRAVGSENMEVDPRRFQSQAAMFVPCRFSDRQVIAYFC